MSGNNSAPKDDWVRLNVGGKVFQTTKDTLSRYPDTFLARLVNGGLSSDKNRSILEAPKYNSARLRKFNFSAPDQMTAMTNRILAKMDDMSKKLPNVGSGPTMHAEHGVYVGLYQYPSPTHDTPPQPPEMSKLQQNCVLL
ncbi:BTB/POZ domain-containing protein [Ditylenchus destructor]|nr:BTB/POZ domain-containing protein [Ditylenchus destructor]